MLVAAYAGIAAYCALSFFLGPSGLFAYRELEARRDAMSKRLAELCATNERLGAELEALRADPERARLEARKLGYLASGETLVVVAGAGKSGERERRAAGDVLPFAEPSSITDRALKEAALAVAIMTLCATLLRDARRTPVQRKRRVHEASRA